MRPQRLSNTELPGSNAPRGYPNSRRGIPGAAVPTRCKPKGEGAAIMESIRRKPLSAFFRCGLTLLGLTCLPGMSDGRTMLFPSYQFHGHWRYVTVSTRTVLLLKHV